VPLSRGAHGRVAAPQQELESYAGTLPASTAGIGWDTLFSISASVNKTQAAVAESMESSLGAADAPRVTNSRIKA
jgi:hypothetical protein